MFSWCFLTFFAWFYFNQYQHMTQTHLNFLLFGLFPKIFKVIFLGGRGGPPNCCAHTIRICVSANMFFFLGTFLHESVPSILNFASDWLSLWWENTKQSAAKKIMFWHLFHGFGAFLGGWEILGGRVRAVPLGGVEGRADWQDLPITVISSYPSVTGKWDKKMLANTNTKNTQNTNQDADTYVQIRI